MTTKEISIDSIHENTIKEVMKKMRGTMILSGYSESTINKIELMWRQNLKKEQKTEFANLGRIIKERIVKPAIEIKVESPKPRPKSPNSDDKYSEIEEDSADDYNDPALEEFKKVQRENEEAEKKKEEKKEEIDSPITDDINVSDEDTKLDDPVADVYIHALYEIVKRKKTKWTASLKSCVLQKLGTQEKYFKSSQCNFNSTKEDNR